MKISEATKYLVSDKSGDHLPYTNESGSPDHRLMGAAWAALHNGYRGNVYEGAGKAEAISKLKGIYKSEKMDTPEESDRTCYVLGTTESYNPTSGVARVTIIKPGLNKSGTRNYPAETLKGATSVFEGAKMFADHATEAESKARPEGSVRNWVGQLKNVSAEADGTLKGDAVIIDPPFKAKLDRLNEAGLLGEMGISIRAIGQATKKDIGGKSVFNLESIDHARSVDFVTFPGAGGRIEALESACFIDESVDYTISPKGNKTMELAEAMQKITTVEAENTTLKAMVATLTAKVTESEKASRVAAAKTEVEKQLSESKLPVVAKDRIRKQFEAAESVEKLAQSIKDEEAYIKSVGGTGVTNNGSSHNGEVSEADVKTAKEAQVKAYRNMGFSEAEAKIAAGV